MPIVSQAHAQQPNRRPGTAGAALGSLLTASVTSALAPMASLTLSQEPITTPARKNLSLRNIAENAFDAVTVVSKIATEACEVLDGVPYVGAIAGIVVKIARVKDDMKVNEEYCAELVKRVCLDWESIFLNLLEKPSTQCRDLEEDLKRYEQILNKVQTGLEGWSASGWHAKWNRFIKRGEFKDMVAQYDREFQAFHQRFQMNQMIKIRIAVIELAGAGTRRTAVSHILPPKPLLIVGRDEQIKKILDDLLKQDDIPTHAAILGLGGMGKTTVALSILHNDKMESRYKSNRYFVSCESATNADLLLNNIADAIDMPSAGREQNRLLHQIVAFFRDPRRPVVICLDNLETTWDDSAHRPAVDEIINCLSSIPTLGLIVTIRGKQTPGGSDVEWLKVEIKPVGSEEAQDIYHQRTGKRPDEWALKLMDAVDNIPLAVTIISHLVREDDQSPKSLWMLWLEERTSVLEKGGEDRLSKLDASIKLSVYSPRMDDNSRNLLHLLALLPDGLNSESKISFPKVPHLGRLLLNLERVSLIYVSSLTDTGAKRYNMLSPIREYCQNAANFTPAPWPEWRSTFTEFFTNLVIDHGEWTALNYCVVVPELRNARRILMETIQESAPNTQAAISYTEWSRYIGLCDGEVIRKSLQFMHDPSDLAWGYRTLGTVQQRKDNLDGAEDSLKKSLKFSEQAEDSRAKARALERIGDLHRRRNNLDEAESSLSKAQVLYDEVGSIQNCADVRLSIGRLHMRRDNLDDAEQSFATALPLYEETQDVLGQANVHRNMGELHMERGDLNDAEKSFSAALPLYHQIQDVLGQANVHRNIGELHMKRGDLDDAEKLFSTALALYQQLPDVLGEANVHCSMGELGMKRGDLDDAEKSFSTSLTLFQQIQHILGQANVHGNTGELHMKRGDLDEAEKSFSVALALYQQIQDVDGQAGVNDEIGKMHLERGNLGAAEMAFSTSLAMFEQLRDMRSQEIVRRNIRTLEERKALRLGDDSTGEAASLS